MKPIKKIAGELLLYFYALLRENKLSTAKIISFQRFPGDDGFLLSHAEKNKMETDILKIADGKTPDLYSALKYLQEGYMLDFKEGLDAAGIRIHGVKLCSNGIDIIEGVERGEEERRQFNITFNIKLADNVNVESLLKAELGGLFKLGLL